MSSERCIAFFGVRVELEEVDIELCEMRMHPLLIAARGGGLDHYWANFGSPGEKYYLFIGKLIGILGVESEMELRISADELNAIATFTSVKLVKSGVQGSPSFFLQWEPDS
jgi:hypothetical protein